MYNIRSVTDNLSFFDRDRGVFLGSGGLASRQSCQAACSSISVNSGLPLGVRRRTEAVRQALPGLWHLFSGRSSKRGPGRSTVSLWLRETASGAAVERTGQGVPPHRLGKTEEGRLECQALPSASGDGPVVVVGRRNA